MITPTIRRATQADLEAVRVINDDAIPAVNAQSLAELERTLATAALFDVAEDGDEILGLLVAYGPGADYDSPNYRWFDRRYPRFLYVDRVVVAPAAQGSGLGSAFYGKLERVVGIRGVSWITCEVNVRPPNEASMRFHRAHGFHQVGSQQTEGGSKEVALLRKDVASVAANSP